MTANANMMCVYQGSMNPLFGPVLAPPFETRFVPLSNAYSFQLRKAVFKAAHELQFPREYLAEGTYAWVSGPTYESQAEGRFLRNAGADVVGMSTVPEVLVARQAGVDVLVLSLVTNPVIIPDGYRSARDDVEAEVRLNVFAFARIHNAVVAPLPNAQYSRREIAGRQPRRHFTDSMVQSRFSSRGNLPCK